MKRVYIVLVNWNGWADTLECLESLLQLDYPDYRVVIVDNDSSDSSVARIRAWACDDLDLLSVGPEGSNIKPSTSRSLRFLEYDQSRDADSHPVASEADIVLIRSHANLGFAAGNNLGLNYVQMHNDAAYVWLLNNDTFVDPASLSALVSRIKSKPLAGICGSTLLRYDDPGRVQALGGAYYCRLLALAWHLGQWRRLPANVDAERVERWMSYVVGASMLVSREFLEQVGLMSEDYFLYYEEIDWVTRARGRFTLGYATDSLIYHKVGGSIGTRSHPGRKSLICDYYSLRSRILFTRRYFPKVMPIVRLGLCVEFLTRLLFGKWQRAGMVLSLMTSGRQLPPVTDFMTDET